MFLPNEFTDQYYAIINFAKSRVNGEVSRKVAKSILGYVEKHHIIPKSIGGTNNSENLVWLTASEHLEVHLLLVNMVEREDHKRKMYAAAVRMCNPQSRTQLRIFENAYSEIRKKSAEFHANYMKIKHAGNGNPFYNKKHTEKSKKLISDSGKGLKRSPETKNNISRSKLGNKNPATAIVTCPHCLKTGKAGGMRKHHFIHCKNRDPISEVSI